MRKDDMRRFAGALAVLAVLAGLAGPVLAGTADADPAAARRLKGFEKFVDEQLLKYHVPGASVAIIEGTRVIYARGFGKRDLDSGLPVTERTIMPIGSSTKAFTTFVIGTLVDEGKLDWDKPVRTYVPGFRMYDPFAAERMTLRDMACHRSGLPRHELSWIGSPFSREELFERLRYLEPSADFRARYGYQNLVYMAAGYIAGKVAGSSWERLVAERIFEPLGMDSANFTEKAALEKGETAKPYLFQDGKFEEREMSFGEDAVGPSGSICANVLDTAKWVQVNLNNGEYGEKRLISEATLRLIHTPQVTMEGDSPDPIEEEMGQYRELIVNTYAFGWNVGTYRGHRMVEHGGNTDGFTTSLKMLPDAGLGVVVLTNADHTDMGEVVCYNVFDRLLGLDQLDWSGRMLKVWQKILDMIAGMKQQASAARKEGTKPSHPLGDYAGAYEHPGYGTFTIRAEGDGLKAFYNGHDWPVTHHHYDVFSFEFWMLGMGFLGTFQTGPDGEIASLSLPLEPEVNEIVFTKKPSRELP